MWQLRALASGDDKGRDHVQETWSYRGHGHVNVGGMVMGIPHVRRKLALQGCTFCITRLLIDQRGGDTKLLFSESIWFL